MSPSLPAPENASGMRTQLLAELSDGPLLLNMRDYRNRSDKSDTNGRAMAVTRDLGKTWPTHPADHGALPEPTCMASMISHHLADGRHVLLFSNPRKPIWSSRKSPSQSSSNNEMPMVWQSDHPANVADHRTALHAVRSVS